MPQAWVHVSGECGIAEEQYLVGECVSVVSVERAKELVDFARRSVRLGDWRFGAVLLGLVSFCLFAFRLGQPGILMFDETHYVPAARALLDFSGNTNTEHPLFAKTLVAAGIAVFGDNAIGWRVGSLFMGVLCVVSVGWIAQQLTRSGVAGVGAGVLTLLNFMVFIHARIGMLDMAMAGCFAAGFGLFLSAARADARRVALRLVGAGVLFGLAMGSKWAVVPSIFFCGLAMGLVTLWARLRAGGRNWLAIFWLDRGAPWPGVSLVGGGLVLTGATVFAYFATFWPAFFLENGALAPWELVSFQFHMLERQSMALSPHPYQSEWWQWPYIGRAIWYLYEPVEGVQRGVLLVGNPAVMFGGLLAMAYCGAMAFYDGARGRGEARGVALSTLVLAVVFFAASYGIWPIMPKKIGFYFYYLMSSLTLSIALAIAFWDMVLRAKHSRSRWPVHCVYAGVGGFGAVSFGFFVYFYPILSAMALEDGGAFVRWAWFNAWR